MDFMLTDEQQMLQDSVRSFVRRECPPDVVAACAKAGEHREDIWHKFAAAGWLGVGIDPAYGGSGGNIVDSTLVVEAASPAGDAIGPLFPTMCFGGHLLATAGSEEQKKTLLPELVAGRRRFALSLTEPGGGTDVLGAMRTTAAADGDDWVINGGKIFTSAARSAHHLIVAARTRPIGEGKKAGGVTLFLVDTDAAGVSIDPIEVLSGEDTNIVGYDAVRVGSDRVIGEVDRGFYHLIDMLNHERIGTAALCLGWAQAALDEVIAYAGQRQAFGGAINRFQSVQHSVARMHLLIEQARLMVYRAAWLQSQARPCGPEATAAKAVAAENCFTACDLGMQVMGGIGYTTECGVNRYWRRTRLYRLAPIANEMALNFIAESLGMPRSF
ncbi:acyl-CoA dehydrogenase family protein [Mycolicibacterium holsaticum]|jgi:acyl-CoA dehydrogenase|uniref:acyl-CoA dehydrogenase family protein n=1 Tax=Mycolicibacterium holsaticum TaxID=152142 RepID=UPI001C7CE280|nr:acyl-CoA dehydrogenase family protein [Mycolicibacterium holsaticum]MDA4105773.1 acyl-CoA dehydrogenase [Mycolicibacterium holsaticum DSM 44478 = JCM 12374]QZA13862.1 acyl-CoA/acyl-ACP dehydrogenase [Mycolicibacterium holsaticum DSM 44478 = JCM 12374]UNC08679.1 acyl-CoA/acyl-ACP dehydrogenase [Mycolicibacterium holsaticum DSM 44478 = JCM 12374]